MDVCPPPHMVLHEPLDDKSTRKLWSEYTQTYRDQLDVSEVDAARLCSIDEFSKWFEIWVTSKSSKRIKLLIVWHAHFLSLACQQTLRRWLETKSYRCRVWFHAEMLNNMQSAIMSRCVLKFVPVHSHVLSDVSCVDNCTDMIAFWRSIKTENELRDRPLSYK
jgi:hypothetical protein